MKSSPSAPPAPDPAATAGAQSASNIQTAIANAQLNRVNQQTPWGAITYNQGAPGANGVPTWSSTVTLSPQQQALLDQQQGMGLQRGQLAQQFLGQVPTGALNLNGLPGINNRGHIYSGPPPQAQPQAQGQPPQGQPQGQSNSSIDQAIQSAIAAAMAHQAQTQAPQGAQPQGQPSPQPQAQAPQAQPQQPDTGATNANYWINKLTQGGKLDPLGSSGFNVGYGMSQHMMDPGGTQNPQMNQYGYYSTDGSEGTSQTFHSNDPNIGADGVIHVGGKPFAQVANNAGGGVGGSIPNDGRIVDYSRLIYDPKYGILSPTDNFKSNSHDDFMNNVVGFALPAAGLGGMAMGAMGGGAGGAATAGDESAGLSMGNTFGSPAASSGAPITDLSVQAQQPSLFQQGMTNLQQGRGLLGLGRGASAGGGLLAQLLRSRGSTGGSR